MTAPGQRSRGHRYVFQATVATALVALSLQVFFGLGSIKVRVENGAQGIAMPILRLGSSVHRAVEPFWLSFFEVKQMRAELEQLRAEQLRDSLHDEARIAKLVQERALEIIHQNVPEEIGPLRAVPVLKISETGGEHLLWIGAGSDQGIETGMVVFGNRSIIGLVEFVRADSARVRLVTDGKSRWGAEVSERGERGLLYGLGSPERVELRFERTATETKVGDAIVSTGMAQSLAPGGIDFGVVEEVTRNRRGEPVAIVRLLDKPSGLRTVFVQTGKRLDIDGAAQ